MVAKADVFMSNVRMRSLTKMGLITRPSGSLQPHPDLRPLYRLWHRGGRGLQARLRHVLLARCGAMRDWSDPEGFPFSPPGASGTPPPALPLPQEFWRPSSAVRTPARIFVTSSLHACGLWYNQTGIPLRAVRQSIPALPQGGPQPLHAYLSVGTASTSSPRCPITTRISTG